MAERPEDLNLPSSVVTRIIKESLPGSVNISKDARLAISKAASVFVLYSTSCANNFSMQHKRKTISAQDVYEAMKEMEFSEFIEPLKMNLEAYKAGQKDRKDQNEKKKSENNGDGETEKMGDVEEVEEGSEEQEVES